MKLSAFPRWAVVLLLLGCNTGSYPLDIFPEMHYQPSYRPLEPTRLSPPDGAVPVTGRAPSLNFAQAGELANPLAPTPDNLAQARELYRVNCAVCHGPGGDGQGALTPYYARSTTTAPVPPTNLASERVRARTDGQLWWIIRHGLGNMPSFDALLTDQEIWHTVLLIRQLQRQ
jgi:mono/diheme cytochrome c family protein